VAVLVAERRTRAVETGALVVEDDYDGEFRYDRHPVGSLQALAPDRVVYAGTASKTLARRSGWPGTPPDSGFATAVNLLCAVLG